VLADFRVDDWVLMRADKGQRKLYSDDKPKTSTCRGRFWLAQIAELPKQRVAGVRLQSRASKKEGNRGKVFVYYAHEVEKEKE